MLIRLAEVLGPPAVRIWGRTLRVSVEGKDDLREARRAGSGGVLFALWHAHLLLLAYTHRRQNIHVLVSQHRDGELIARVISRLGFGTARGSTTRGGREALFQLGEIAHSGADLAITPDGPRGPREVVQPGVLRLAQWTGLPLVPLAAAGSRDRALSSWDGFRIPRFFSRCRVVYGSHLVVPRHLSPDELEAFRQELERRLHELTARTLSW